MKRFFLIPLICIAFALPVQGQDFHMPKASPTVTINQGFSTSFIKLEYSRPSVKGREIFGHLVPYGRVWRTGANASTKITFGEDVELGGTLVKAGTYSLYTIPEENEWVVILNKDLKNWGTSGFDEKHDVFSQSFPAEHVGAPQETFSISIEEMTNTRCLLVFSWADVKVRIPVKANNNERIMRYLDKELQGDKPPYYKAASYYYSTDQKLDEATKYVSLAIKENPKAYYMHWLQARIYEKRGMHEKAVSEAKMAAEKAKGSAFAHEYEQHYKDMLNKH